MTTPTESPQTATDDDERDLCRECGEPPDSCGCCNACEGQGYFEDGGCGGGCDFCRPFPRCGACRGTGKKDRS